MSTGNAPATLQTLTPTPLEYVNPENPFDPDPSKEPEGDPGNDHGNLADPTGEPDPSDPDDGPDDDPEPSNPPSPSPNDNHPDGDRFIEAIMQLLESLRDLWRESTPKSEKIKVRDPDTFDGSNPWKLHDFLVSCNLHFRDHPQVFASDVKRILFIPISKVQHLVGLNQYLMTPPTPLTGYGITRLSSVS